MGRYINNNLVDNEHILYTAKYHWSVWLWPYTAVAVSFILLIVACFGSWGNAAIYISAFLAFVSLIYFLYRYFKIGFDEFAVTTQRVFIKKGIFAHETTEHNLKKIETVSVEQGFWERLFSRGTLTFSGTGSTITRLPMMASPFAFRKAIQSAMDNSDKPFIDPASNRDTEAPAYPAAQPAQPSAPAQPAAPAGQHVLSRVEQLERLKKLFQEGVITEEEFINEKKEILSH